MPDRMPDIWTMIFEQTPVVLRYLLGVLTLGVFTLMTFAYRLNLENVEKVRKKQEKDMDETRRSIERVHERVDELKNQISANHNQLYRELFNRRPTDIHRGDA